MTKKTDCFDWKELLDTGKLKKKRKVVLEKYIKHHNLSVAAKNNNIFWIFWMLFSDFQQNVAKMSF